MFAWRAVAMTLLLGACAGYGPGDLKPGASIDEVRRTMGTETGRYALPDGGMRLEYARGPLGTDTFMIDFDGAGRVVRIRQVLTEANFLTVQPGATRDEVLATLGRPSEVRHAWRNGELWTYRYSHHACLLFVVTMNPDGRVRDAGYVPDPACNAPNDRAPNAGRPAPTPG